MSLRLDTADWFSGSLVVGVTSLGVRGADIPATGANGPGILYSGLSLPADADAEFRVVLTSVPAGLSIFVDEDTSFYATAADGTYVCTYDAYQDGVLYGSSTLTLVFGAVEPPPPPPPPPPAPEPAPSPRTGGGGKGNVRTPVLQRAPEPEIDIHQAEEREITEILTALVSIGVL